MASNQGHPIISNSAIAMASVIKKSKGVNAFIIYRVYYSAAFPSMAQKYRSALLKKMWAKDPYKSTWKLLGKVYTTVRDHVGGKVDIMEFLIIACPQLGVVSPGNYLAVFHWKFEKDAAGEIDFVQDESKLITVEGPAWTSEFDIVQNCLKNGYQIEDHDELLNKMRVQPEKMLSFMPDAETHRTHFENLVIKDPVAAVMRLMRDQPTMPDYTDLGVNVAVVDNHAQLDNHNGLFAHGNSTSYGGAAPQLSQDAQMVNQQDSTPSYGGTEYFVTQEALMVHTYDWDHVNTPDPSPHGINVYAIEQDETALFDISNPYGVDRLMTDFAALDDDANADSIWTHDSMTIKSVTPPS